MSLATAPAHGRGRLRRGKAPEGDRKALLVQAATVGGVALVLLGLVQLMSTDFGAIVPVLVIAPVGVSFLVWMVGKLAEKEDRAFLIRVMVAGLLLRVGLALIIHLNLPVWFFAPDQVTYEDVGWRTLLYHRGVGSMPWQIQNTAEVGYFYWNAFLFWVFGFVPLAPKLVNAFVGTASALLCYRLAGELAGRDTARTAAVLTMFFPSLVLWSTLNLRDPIVLLVTISLFLSVVRLRARPSGLSFFAVVLALAMLVLFRDYVAAMALFGLVGSSVISKGRGLPLNLLFGVILFGLAVLAYQQFGLGAKWVESASFEAISQQRQFLATGGTAFRPDTDISTPLRGIQFFPVGLAFFLLSPFPWQIGSALTLMTLPEQLVWYALIPSMLAGGVFLIRERYQGFGPVLLFLALTTGIYALVEGNAGTAYRHRAQVLVFFLIIASVGITLRQIRRLKAAEGKERSHARSRVDP